MQIGMITACYKPVINGVTRMVSLYKAELEALGHEVTVFTLGRPDPKGEEPGVIRSPGLPLTMGYHLTAGYNARARRRLRQMDVLHCHHLLMGLELAYRYGRSPIVYTNHTRYDLYTGNFVPQSFADRVLRRLWPRLTALADAVVTPSASMRQVLRSFGVRRPITVIENGVDLRPFHTPPAPLNKTALGLAETAVVAAYVGRLSPEKNLPGLLHQFARARRNAPHLHLLLVGQGPLAGELRQRVKASGLSAVVHFTGELGNTQVANHLAAADFFVTASVSEVHPLTLIEALAAGLPIAAPVAPGIVDIVRHGQTGLLTSPPHLFQAMCSLANEPAQRRRMAALARQASYRYDIRRTVQHSLALYERLCETYPDRSRRHSAVSQKPGFCCALASTAPEKSLASPESAGS
jgi:1,2-diacylglycerol 3-alpha-glucosyltransferase